MANGSDSIVGASPAFLDLMDQISRAAPMNRSMLVIGERGTGKELIAARLHYLSNRWNKTFQKLNCAALPETLLESELFGYEPGAFTGASTRRAGRFELAHEGTLFLDEIGTLSANAQEKLLRVIEYGEFERLGGTETLNVDVRVIGATNIDLPAAADAGRFRHDLLDRLAFDVITVPPLRARPEDIHLLAEHFGRQMASDLEWLVFPGFTEEALAAIAGYAWPGNVRELKNVIERAVYRAWDGEKPIDAIIFDPFESPYRPGKPTEPVQSATGTGGPVNWPEGPEFDLRRIMASAEKSLVTKALADNRHNQRATARAVGLTYDQLRHTMKKHGLL